MELWIGTSGYSYSEWKGNFYPEKIPAKNMLRYYAERLTAVEINNTFYRFPKPNVLENWMDQVPEHFRFSLKASRKITHFKRLKDTSDEVSFLFDNIALLGYQLGVILFQLPPYLKKDLARLDKFIEYLPDNAPAAFEFRHESWYDDEIYETLRKKDYALVVSDTDDDPKKEIISTASWGYLRLRRTKYSKNGLKNWEKLISSQDWERAFVFFKHEDKGTGPKVAGQFLELL